MKRLFTIILLLALLGMNVPGLSAQQRRPIDSKHPLWLVHVDVWNKADPQKIIDLIPENIKPYVCMNLSLSCQYDTEKNVYKMPQNAVKTYKSWATICQANGLWFTCQPASGGHTHIQDDDLEIFEYFFKRFPNFLGWNYAEQFWGFDEAGDKSSSSQTSRIALFAKLVKMSHEYGGFLTVSFCGNIWSHPLNPLGMMKRNSDLYKACQQYPEAMLWLYKYTTSSCFYNNESVTYGPFISGLASSYGVRYDNCGWNGALDALLGKDHGKKYPVAAGIGTVMEQTCVNGGAVWDGPELIWTEDFQNLNNTSVDGYTRRNWGTFPGFKNAWLDMFSKIIDGTLYIPTREEVVKKTKIVVINNVTSGNDEDKYAAWGDLYDGLYKQNDPFNRGNGQWMDNFCYFKKTGRYGAIPITIGLNDDLAKTIPVKVNKSNRSTKWPSQTSKVNEFNRYYPEISTGDLYVNRFKNQLVTYTPYTYMNANKTAEAAIPLKYNTCDTLKLIYGKLSSGLVKEYADHIDFYLNNYRTDTTTTVLDRIIITGVTSEPNVTYKKRASATVSQSKVYNAEAKTFTYNIRHNGPVDISISCSGDATERDTDVVSNTDLALDLPKQPEDYYGQIVVEAEDMDFRSINSCVTDPYGWYPSVRGHAGNGFADMGTNTAGSLRHRINIKHPGEYYVYVRYMSTSRAGNLSVSVNGNKQDAQVEKTANNEWKRTRVTATLKAGQNELIVTNSAGINMYIDNVTYCPTDVPDEKYAITIRDSEFGSVVAECDSAAEGEKVKLTVVPKNGYRFVGWTVIHGGVKIAADNSFTMPDDNVTIAPMFEDMTTVYVLDYTNTLGGAIPEGWVAKQENNDEHAYPNTFSSGARTFSGFVGYQGKALYWREVSAEYGRQAGHKLTLKPGRYKLTYAMAAWKSNPKYVTRILGKNDAVIAKSLTAQSASPNVNGNTGGNVTAARKNTLEFTIKEAGDYVISFTNSDAVSGYDEFLLLMCQVNSVITEDVNKDGIVDTQDVLAVYDYMSKYVSGAINTAYDVNLDGTVDTQDVLQLYEYILQH